MAPEPSPRARPTATPEDPRAAGLREALADRLVAEGAVSTPRLAAALRVVPRHRFVPGLPLELAYANQVVFVQRDRAGVPTSSVSAPDIQAIMLEQAEITPGARLLEIGSGGYNAALMAELAGPDGEVTTVDIDPDVAARARACLDDAGYPEVRVVTADAEDGVPEYAPYDRVVVTVEAWDLPPAWIGQLTPDGRIVVPLRLRGLTRSLAFDRVGEHLVSRSARMCGFVKMRGAGRHAGEELTLHAGDLALEADDVDALPSAEHVEALLRTPRAERWSGVRVWRWEPWDTLPLWLATAYPGYCQLTVHLPGAPAVPGPPGAPGSEPLEPALRSGTPAVATETAFAHLTATSLPDGRVELGAHAFGPDAATLAADLVERIAIWDRDHRRGPSPTITAWPIDAPAPEADLVVARRHVRITVDWPRPDSAGPRA
ncbi:methyltransferase, FxLD system [Catenulispora subtropica]|uniref:Protein-L-isoaspartate O-methyltransferase n=1 Tax=Catenulispora subtropica TaxID=450798 RepID=A0ABN2RCU5_9ACTN